MMIQPDFTLLYVNSPMESATFYQQLLGIAPVETSATFALFVLPNGHKLGLWSRHTVAPAATPVGGSEMAFTVESADALASLLENWQAMHMPIVQGITVMDFGHTFVATDPDGHRLRAFWPCEQ
ncbi:VOC family protein [Leeia oryzae]|uniref:VOC family protein n=1 Tax=Leeia oryzae TaxID=356662 RepID=UPI001FDEF361|nr:VOC family protein [Leeia oryzae]